MTERTNIRESITKSFHDALERTDSKLLVDNLSDDIVLLQSGLDSLGFAILVAILDEELGFDPFAMMDEPVYPVTFGEFVSIYEKISPTE
ncbi:hypothetical protein M3P05_18360 [Sansalvadorimonas sp. 2012CJ34-2]|uniref:Carrier domain-containing protein n=1 Tax=Parendozoicomonas callyspongiae TaxID=2942213 RepID=A0ABT0PKH9_9GAMM|nr:hypothetical protein [Sansalvadorimonas sp. 2012CJ34-2]MCL6271885.1 hypothetical protein [Sansalvadorimonas sp. 2012CJ34-2]